MLPCSLARQIGLQVDESAPRVRAAVHAELARTPGWCLAVDDVLDMEAFAECIPWGEEVGGHVIFTSRRTESVTSSALRAWDRQEGFTLINVGALESEEAVELLLTWTGESDATTAAKIGKIVEHHAAAVADAANYVHQDPVLTLADYRLIIQSELDALNGLDDATGDGGDEENDVSPAPLV